MSSTDPLVAPVYVTARNAESAFGLPWESLRAIAERFGVKPVQGVYAKRIMYRAADLVRVIERADAEAYEGNKQNDDEADVERELRELGFAPNKSRT